MNSLIAPGELQHLLAASAAAPALPDALVLGMPHLCMTGLSETWLLKECSHRHWFLLARAAGLPVPDFRDSAGEPIYAAFLAVSVREAAFDSVREHDRLVFASRLARISRTQFMSLHTCTVAGRSIGEIVLTSAFVRREHKGKNRSVARIEVPGLPPLRPDPRAVAYAAETATLRANRWHTHLGFDRDTATVIDRYTLDPCPAQDFNGADFLYFASFQAFVDRAEWAFFRPHAPFPVTRRRDIVYRGNIDPGEHVVASLLQFRRDNESLALWYRLAREPDGATIAEIFTLRGVPALST
jgi:probable biosynthetic protein (TIGR04099 family)